MDKKISSNLNNPLDNNPSYDEERCVPSRIESNWNEVPTPRERVHQLLGHNEGEEAEGAEGHPIFSEMSTLHEIANDQFEWREAARWIKFEEDVEEGGQRWSKPYISSLSLNFLFDLRSILLNGTVILDLEASNLNRISEVVIENMMNSGQLPPTVKDKVNQILMSQHRHLFELAKHKSRQKCSSESTNSAVLSENGPSSPKRKENKRFMKKVPSEAEAANILIGETSILQNPVCAFVRLKEVGHLGNITEVNVPTRFIFVLLVPKGQLTRCREIGRSMGTLLSDEIFCDVVYKAHNKGDVISGIDEFLGSVTVLPPALWDPSIRIEPLLNIPTQTHRKGPVLEELLDEEEEERRMREEAGLIRTQRLFGGLINDVKRKAPWYWSDFKDGVSAQSISTICFLYFACLTPIITFGGLLGQATGNNIAAMESLVSGLVCGVFYGLFSGQPLTILGSTGPVLVFETIVYEFCQNLGWDYLELRLWIGLWVAVILMILVAFDASSFVCYITRFTEENFATLIALIFIIKALEEIYEIGQHYPMVSISDLPEFCECNVTQRLAGNELLRLSNKADANVSVNIAYVDELDWQDINGSFAGEDNCHKYYPDVFTLSLILFAGTFIISTSLKNFQTAPFFPTWVRNFLSDFAVIIGIVSMTLLDFTLGIETPKLHVPEEFKPTNPQRDWFVPPFGHNPWWTPIISAFPALLACILLFMDQQITSVIINRKEHKLKKGGGYHLDLFVLAILIAVNSVMGLPWFVAATVLAINHVNSLKLQSETSAPGDKPQFLGVRENRVTQIIIFLLIGGSVFMTPLLKKIPMAVLFGVFLYMGIAALHGSQLFDRILIIFMPAKYQPDYAYLRDIPINRVHMFTCIQLLCLASLWVIKSFSQTSILFPLMLVVMIGVRKLLDRLFTQRELKILDDVLPEFKRKERLEEQSERKQDLETTKNEEMTIVSLKADQSRKVISIPNVAGKTAIWRNGNFEGSSGVSSKTTDDTPLRPPLGNNIFGVQNLAFIDGEELERRESSSRKVENENKNSLP